MRRKLKGYAYAWSAVTVVAWFLIITFNWFHPGYTTLMNGFAGQHERGSSRLEDSLLFLWFWWGLVVSVVMLLLADYTKEKK